VRPTENRNEELRADRQLERSPRPVAADDAEDLALFDLEVDVAKIPEVVGGRRSAQMGPKGLISDL
jgi:hypothetical protein